LKSQSGIVKKNSSSALKIKRAKHPMASERHTFIVRFWLEPRDDPNDAEIWRGELEELSFPNAAAIKRFERASDAIKTITRRMEILVSKER
jgi:hypothetical protein